MEQGTTQTKSFIGTYDHTLDAKGRVSLPAKFRKSLPVTLNLIPYRGAILVFTEEGFEKWIAKFFPEGDNPRSDEDDAMMFYLMGMAEETEIDSAGRISISAKARASAGLEKDVAIVGRGDRIEIVSRAAYEAKMAKAAELFAHLS